MTTRFPVHVFATIVAVFSLGCTGSQIATTQKPLSDYPELQHVIPGPVEFTDLDVKTIMAVLAQQTETPFNFITDPRVEAEASIRAINPSLAEVMTMTEQQTGLIVRVLNDDPLTLLLTDPAYSSTLDPDSLHESFLTFDEMQQIPQLQNAIEGPVELADLNIRVVASIISAQSGVTINVAQSVNEMCSFSLNSPTIAELLHAITTGHQLGIRKVTDSPLSFMIHDLLDPAVGYRYDAPMTTDEELRALPALQQQIDGPVAFTDLDISTVMQILQAQVDEAFTYTIDEEAHGLVSLSMRNPTLADMLIVIADANGLDYQIHSTDPRLHLGIYAARTTND